MPVVYPELPGLVVADAVGPKERLNAEVWRHAELARQRGLSLVIEVYARSVLASRRLTEWWKSGSALVVDTLTGIYLLRVDLQAFGPEAVLRLTPYAAVGAPVFVGWNPVGQVCSRTQFDVLTPEAMALPLSAFIEDVLAGKPHSLNPTPSLGSAERTREAAELRRVGQAWNKQRLVSPRELPKFAPEGADALPPVAPAHWPAALDEATAGAEEGTPSEPSPGAGVSAPPSSLPPLEVVLSAARSRFAALEDATGVQLDLQLANLRALDVWLDAGTEEGRLAFAKDFGAVVAVYVGDTIRRHVKADWIWDESHAESFSKLVLEGEVLGSPLRSAPGQWVVDTLGDSTRSLYGQALAWCRLV